MNPDVLEILNEQLKMCGERNEKYTLTVDGSTFIANYLTDCIKYHPDLLEYVGELETALCEIRETLRYKLGSTIDEDKCLQIANKALTKGDSND